MHFKGHVKSTSGFWHHEYTAKCLYETLVQIFANIIIFSKAILFPNFAY